MEIFKIKLKTRNGNSVKNKECITAFFRVTQSINVFNGTTTSRFTFRVKYNSGVMDPKKVFKLKNETSVIPMNSLIVKVVLNLLYVIKKITTEKNIVPDFIMLMSPDFPETSSVRKVLELFLDLGKDSDPFEFFGDSKIKKNDIDGDELRYLNSYRDYFSNTKIMLINPDYDPKYAKSRSICGTLKERFSNSREPKIE